MELKYRPEIDGLRTIAVIAVIIYHLEIVFGKTLLLKGGFLGVDVFFVISGFLITSIIMSEYNRSGTLSIANFYVRRARRILPALFVVILVSLPFAWNLLLPTQLVDFSKSVLSSLAFGSNFYWDSTLQEYGAESALIKPFLHTWSLAVEEQYYIVFPLVMLAIYKWLKPYTITLLTAGFLLSLQFSESMTGHNASFSFYMLPSRFWELLAGSLLANILYFHPQEDNDALLNKTMPMLGLFLIFYSMVFVDFDANHPGFITLMPVIGTVLIIWFANENDLVTKVLSSKVFVGIGLISYSLYLWHYPIYAFGRIIDPTPTWHDKIFWIVLTFSLSLLTYIFVEKPFRNKKLIKLRQLIGFLMITVVVITSISAFSIYKYHENLSENVDFRKEEKKRHRWSEYGLNVCVQKEQEALCSIGTNVIQNILVVGDSMAPDAVRIIGINYPQNRYILNYSSGCSPGKVQNKKSRHYLTCIDLNKKRFSPKSLIGVDGVVINTLIADPVLTENYVKFLKQHGMNNIIIFGNYLRNKRKMSELIVEYKSKEAILNYIGSEHLMENNLKSDDKMRQIATKYDLEFISVRDFACQSENDCMIFLENIPYSWDRQHFSVEFSDFLAKKMSNSLTATWLGSNGMGVAPVR